MNYYSEPKNIPANLKQDLMLCNQDTYLLGRLAEGQNYYKWAESNEPVSIIRGVNKVGFCLEALCEIPEPLNNYFSTVTFLENDVLFIGLDQDQGTTIKDVQYNYLLPQEQIDYWYKKLRGKLIRFKPKVVLKKDKKPFLNLEIEAIEQEDYNGHSTYKIIPVVDVNMDNETFEGKLLSKSYIQLKGYRHIFKQPEYIVCGEYIYSNFENLIKHKNESNMWKLESSPEKIRRIRRDYEGLNFLPHIHGGNDYVMFLESKASLDINDFIYEYGEPLEALMIDTENELSVTKRGLNSIVNEEDFQSASIHTNSSLNHKDESFENGECSFLKYLQNTTLREGLIYRPLDLVNFHVSIKTNPLTVVAGMSGTGKTQLARAYGHALGLNEVDKNLLFLPINPSYLEPADILGYLNPTTGLYVPSETGLVEILLEAEQNPEKLYMVIFDEMNLSQVEHWFAPFLSLLELKPESRRLSLYAEGSICHNSFKYKNNVLIGENIVFIGTINLDETTKDFSDRLLDRVNVVTLSKTSFADMRQWDDVSCPVQNFDFDDFKSWVSNKPGITAYTTDELLFFDELHEVINRIDNQKGVSYRLINRIGNYINNIPQITKEEDRIFELTKERAIDLGIKQRLLTKIKGSERQIGELLGTKSTSSDTEKGPLVCLLESDSAKNISTFEETLTEINRKALELELYGYTY